MCHFQEGVSKSQCVNNHDLFSLYNPHQLWVLDREPAAEVRLALRARVWTRKTLGAVSSRDVGVIAASTYSDGYSTSAGSSLPEVLHSSFLPVWWLHPLYALIFAKSVYLKDDLTMRIGFCHLALSLQRTRLTILLSPKSAFSHHCFLYPRNCVGLSEISLRTFSNPSSHWGQGLMAYAGMSLTSVFPL